MTERLVVAAPAGRDSPSAHYRFAPLGGAWAVEFVAAGTFPDAQAAAEILERGGADATLVLQRVLPSDEQLGRWRGVYRHVVFDLDDAIYTAPPDLAATRVERTGRKLYRLLVRGSRDASSRRRPLVRALRGVDACVVGNSILRDWVTPYARQVVVVPTTFDPVPGHVAPTRPVVVWHGLLSNMQYLRLVGDALQAVAAEIDFTLRIVASETWADAPVPVEFVPWSPQAMRSSLLSSSVGLAPLVDAPWTRGKCAFRSIQYGAHGLPTIASPVGITDEIVLDGVTGYLADSAADWERALRKLLGDAGRAQTMGRAAQLHIAEHYAGDVAVAGWQALLARLDGQ